MNMSQVHSNKPFTLDLHASPEAPLICFFNGGGMGQWMWQPLKAALLAHSGPYHFLTFDYTGFGQGPIGVFQGLEQEARLAHGYILSALETLSSLETLSTQKAAGTQKSTAAMQKSTAAVYLIGHSIGAQLLLHYLTSSEFLSEQLPLRRAYAISALNQPNPKLLKSTLAATRWVMPLTQQRWFARLNAKGFNLPKDLFDSYFEDSKPLTLEWLSALLSANMSAHIQASALQASAAAKGFELRILVGAKEPKMMIQSAYSLTSQPLVMADAGHDIPFLNRVAEWF